MRDGEYVIPEWDDLTWVKLAKSPGHIFYIQKPGEEEEPPTLLHPDREDGE
jgi:hypothetical protein